MKRPLLKRPERGLYVNVYRAGDRAVQNVGGGKHEGIDPSVDHVLLLVEGGIYAPKPEEPVLVIVPRTIMGKHTPYATLADWVANENGNEPTQVLVEHSFGGSYIGSSDSRVSNAIGFYGAMPVHDRNEL